MTIGQRLRDSREAQHLTLDMLQETTKIQKRYLKAIEEENFHILPGKFYAKAFIKEYANAVGLDSNELLDEFESQSTEVEAEQGNEYTRIKRSSSEKNTSKNTSSLLPKITVFLLIVAIIFAATYFYQKTTSENGGEEIENDNSNEVIRAPEENDQSKESVDEKDDEENVTDKKKESKKSEKKDSKDDDEKATFKITNKDTKGTPESTIEAKNVEDSFKVKVTASKGDSWLTIKKGNNGEQVFSDNIANGQDPEEFDFENVDEIYFIIGNASVLKIEIDGEPIEYPVDPKQKVFQKIKLILK